MASTKVTPAELAKLVGQFGSEDHLADRLSALRAARGWSQDRLAAEMAAAGCPLPQSAISKIEKPAPGGRRAISLDEALAFSRVFEVPMNELVLPGDALSSVELLRHLADGPSALKLAESARRDYEALVGRIADLMAQSPDHRLAFADHSEAATTRYRDNRGDSFTLTFLDDVMTEFRAREARA